MWKMNFSFVLPVLLVLAGCTSTPTIQIAVHNSSELSRENELVAVPLKSLQGMHLGADDSFVILNTAGIQMPYQITYDSLLIIPVTVEAGATVVCHMQRGVPEAFDTVSCGKYYPERLDDIAWENDKAAYRAYGPSLQQKGEKAYGYDVFTKSVNYPVVEKRYRLEMTSKAWVMVDSLREAGNLVKADSVIHSISYHVDHGNGMDCYSVGPTLGGGTSALLADSSIVYPYCYQKYEILDNGPLRFTVRLTYPPLAVKGDTAVVESRLISLDKGSYLNRTVVRYHNLSVSRPVATGIVIHSQHPDGYFGDASNRYIAYADSTDNPQNGNGVIYLGAVFPKPADKLCVQLFSETELQKYPDALGHVLAVSRYMPETLYEYYWGSGWSKAGVKDEHMWEAYLRDYVYRMDHPLQVTIR